MRHRSDTNADAICKAFERMGCSVWRVNAEVDAIIGYGGMSMLIEIRQEGQKAEPRDGRQKRFHERWTGGVRWVQSMDDVAATVATLRKWHAAVHRMTLAD